MASQLGLPLVPDTSYYYPRFYLGLSEGEKRESGEIPSCDMCFDGRYYAVSGFITGAIGAKFPGMNHLVEGVVDTAVSAGERLAYAVFDDSMSWDEKWAYAFDPGQMVADFVTGVVIGEILDGIMAAIQNKLRSIFANYDAAMREALESGSKGGTDVRNRQGRPVLATEKTLDMALDPETYANTIAEKYGINLRGSGQSITIKYNADLRPGIYGRTTAANPYVIEIGSDALVSEEELANTIAHELNHARDFIRGGIAPESSAYSSGNALSDYIMGGR